MNLPQAIYERSLLLPEAAAQEALDFIDFLRLRYASPTPPAHLSATQEFLAAVAGSWGDDVADDVGGADLCPDTPRQPL